MGYLLLLILKIIGITLAVLIGLLLLIILLVLFVPIRYKAYVSYTDKIFAKAKATWLLSFISVHFLFEDNKPLTDIHVFGVSLSHDDKKDKKSAAKKKDKDKHKDKQKHDVHDDKPPEPEDTFYDISIEGDEAEDSGGMQPAVTDKSGSQVGADKSVQTDAKRAADGSNNAGMQGDTEIPDEPGESEADSQNGADEGFFHRYIIAPVKKVFEKIKGVFAKIKGVFKHIADVIRELVRRKDLIHDFWYDERVRAAVRFGLDNTKKLFRHILPGKVKGRVAFGTGDPCSTGQALGVLALLYGKYGKAIKIEPDFEEKRLEGELTIKGRIRVFTLLVIGIKVFFNKDIRYLKDSAEALKDSVLAPLS